jgi:hypothetical protein
MWEMLKLDPLHSDAWIDPTSSMSVGQQTSKYNIRNVAVAAMKKSHARIAVPWLYRNVDQH